MTAMKEKAGASIDSAPDLAATAFVALRDIFFDRDGAPRVYQLEDKKDTQDDPLDRYILGELQARLSDPFLVVGAPGVLITPDIAIARPDLCARSPRETIAADSSLAVGMEVKKLERVGGKVARGSGMDFNSTPPCGTVTVYDAGNQPLAVRGFYLFICQERAPGERMYKATALALCDGDLINADFELYKRTIGSRVKAINLGTYADGADRQRPMLVFPNPLAWDRMDGPPMLVHTRADVGGDGLRKVGIVSRVVYREGKPTDERRTFTCYRAIADVSGKAVFESTDPFKRPKRTEATQQRGRFVLPVNVTG